MNAYVRTFLIAGVVIPVFLHVIARASMPWWPDTVSMSLALGVTSVLIVHKARTDREMNRRVWKALRTLAHRLPALVRIEVMPEEHPKQGDVIIWDMEPDSIWWVGTQDRNTAAHMFEGPGAWERALSAAQELAAPEAPIWKRYKDGHFEKLRN